MFAISWANYITLHYLVISSGIPISHSTGGSFHGGLHRHLSLGHAYRFLVSLRRFVLSNWPGRSGLAQDAVHARSHRSLFCFLARVLSRARPRLPTITKDRIE